MRINHFIIGCRDVLKSAEFYQSIFGFVDAGDFIDTGTGLPGKILHSAQGDSDLDILLVPFKEERLPNPQHFAMEADELLFRSAFELAKSKNMKIRAEPSLKSEKLGIGRLDIHGGSYEIFYLLDPGGVNVELMLRIKA